MFTGAQEGDGLRAFLRRRSDRAEAHPVIILPDIAIESDGRARIRVEGSTTATWTPGRYVWQMLYLRGDGSAVLDDLPELNVRSPLGVDIIADDPILDGVSYPIEFSSRALPEVAFQFVVGTIGRDGPPGPAFDLDDMPDLTLFFENGLI